MNLLERVKIPVDRNVLPAVILSCFSLMCVLTVLSEIEVSFFFLAAFGVIGLTLFCIAVAGLNGYHSRLILLKDSQIQEMTDSAKQKKDEQDLVLSQMRKSLELEILAHTEAEAQLRDSEEKYRSLVAALPEGVFIVQGQKIVFSNPSFETLSGYEAGRLKGMPVKTLFEDGEYFDRMLTKDGRYVYIDMHMADIIYDFHPAQLYSITDITEKVMAEKERARLQTKLDKARRMEEFGILAGGMAHDLNNILAGLVSIPDAVKVGEKDGLLGEQLTIIKDSGKRASAMVDDLLSFARGAGTCLEPVNMDHVVAQYMDSPEFRLLEKEYPNVSMVQAVDRDLPPVMGSQIQLQKIIMNLVTNAFEAASLHDGKVAVCLKSEQISKERPCGESIIKKGSYLFLSVENNGKGILKTDLDRIFEPFYSKKVMGRSGSGLGLSIVWNTVRAHNGYIDVQSDDEATIFKVCFPTADKIDKFAPEETKIYTLSDYAGNNEEILVVDDMDLQRRICENLLRRLGYEVQCVSSGEKALAFVKDHPVDLVLLDMVLSPDGVSGLETYQQLLLIDPQIKVIIMSGTDMSEDIGKALDMGAGSYVKKPVSLEKLGLEVKQELTGRKV